MKKNLFLTLCLLSNTTFFSPLLAQVPGSWEKHLVCIQCSLEDVTHFGREGKLDFFDPDHGMLVGDDYSYQVKNEVFSISRFYITSNGGKTWQLHVDSLHSGLSQLLSFKYLAVDFAAGFSGNDILFTIDQGFNWNDFPDYNLDHTSHFFAGKIFSPSIFYKFISPYKKSQQGGFHPAYIERSMDTGQTFQLISDTLASGNLRFIQVYMQDSLNIWALVLDTSSYFYSCLHTIDGGLHWNRFFPVDTTNGKGLDNPVGLGSIQGNDSKETIYFVNYGIGDSLHLISRFDFLYTTDAGISWHIDSSNHGRFAFMTSSGVSKLWGLIGTRDNHNRFHCDTLAYSPNNGKNWYYDTQTIRGDSVAFMKWKDSTHGYIISYADSIIWFSKYIPPTTRVNTKIHTQNNDLFFQVTPTITNNFIHLTSYQAFNGTMSIYDVLGREIMQKTLNVLDGEKKDFSLFNLPSSMYFLTFTENGHYSTERIIKE